MASGSLVFPRMVLMKVAAMVVAGAACTLVATIAAQAPQAATVNLPGGQQFTNTGRQIVAMSPDGTRFVYVANNRLYLKPIGDGKPVEISGTAIPEGVTNPVFSPDGQSLVFWSAADQTLKRIAVAGGTPVTVCQAANPFGMSWTNGEIVFGQGPAGVMRVSANGGTPETIVKVMPTERAHGPQMLPGGDAVLFTILNAGAPSQDNPWDHAAVVVQFLQSGERKTLIEAGSDGRYVPTGHIVYALAGALLAVPFDIRRLETTGKPVPLIEGVQEAGATGSAQFSFSTTGTLIYAPQRPPQIQVALVDRAGHRQDVASVPELGFAPRISPDGKRVAFDTGGTIWIADLANLSARQRLTTGGSDQFPLWTSDGQHIVFTSARDGGVQALYWQRVDGTGDAEQLVKPARAPEYMSAPNQLLSFITLKGNLDYDVWTYSLQDKKAAPLIDTPVSAQFSSRFSHNGRWIAYQSNETGQAEVWVQPYPVTGAKFQITTKGGNRPVWSLDDQELFYDIDNRLFVVPIQTAPAFKAGDPVSLPIDGFIQGPLRRQYDMTPDGKAFLMMFRPAEQVDVVSNWFDQLRRRVPAQ